MATFKAIVINRTASGQTVALTDFDENESDGRQCHPAAGMVDGELQGRPRRHQHVAGGAPVSDDRRHRCGRDRESSSHPSWKAGDKVVLNGWGCGETHLGLYAEKARVKGDWLIALPERFSARDAMAIGTAGYTAMLAVMALERAGITPGRGPVIVTGAAGGVGSTAVALLAKLGYQVTASTGRPEEAGYLKGIGAAEMIPRAELTGPVRPLAKERWAAGIDTVGSTTLANLVDDSLWRRGRCLRARRWHRPAGHGCALYSARGVAIGN